MVTLKVGSSFSECNAHSENFLHLSGSSSVREFSKDSTSRCSEYQILTLPFLQFCSSAVQRLLLAQCKFFKHYCHHIIRNASWKLTVWFTWYWPCVLELRQQLICAGICNWGLFWTFVEHFCNFSPWPPHRRIVSICTSLPIAITHNFDREKTCLACGSRFMGHHVEYHYSSIGFLH